VANWKILVNPWSNEHSFRDELSHHLVFTKNDEEPGCRGELWLLEPQPVACIIANLANTSMPAYAPLCLSRYLLYAILLSVTSL
jgi:hypothetical protein